MKEKTYTIKLDESNWQIVEQSTTASGKPSEKIIGYYGSLEALVKAAHNKMLMIHGLERVQEAMDAAEDIIVKAVEIIEKPAALALAKITRAKKAKEDLPDEGG